MDWNDDSFDDIIVGDRNGYVNYFQRNSDGTLTTGPKVPCAGVIIQVGTNAAPVCVDWDEDSDIDLLVGNETGNIRLYLNDGGESVPVFSTYSTINSSGTPITHYRACPQVFDLNGDGKKDLLVGGNDAYISYYENTGTNEAPAFSGSVQIQSGGAALHEYSGVRFWVDDWNGNGSPDLITSDFDGYVRVYLANTTGISDDMTGLSPTGFSFTVSGSPGDGLFLSRIFLGSACPVELDVYSVDGRLVDSSDRGVLEAGEYTLQIDLTGMPPGVYLAHCRAGSDVAAARLVIAR